MKIIKLIIPITLLLLSGCNKSDRPDSPDGGNGGTPFFSWGRIGAQTISDNYTGTPIIKQIIPGSPASKTELRTGDRIITIDGIDAPDMDIALYIQCKKPGSSTLFSIQRGTHKIEIPIRIGKYPPLEQLTLMSYHSSVAGDYLRAQALLAELERRDTTGEKSVQRKKLASRLSGLAVKPDAEQPFEVLVQFAVRAISLAKDRYRVKQIISLLKRRTMNETQKGLLEDLVKKCTVLKGVKK